MPFDSSFQPGSINQIGQGLRGPGERHGLSHTLSAHFAASAGYGTAGTSFQRSPYFYNQINPLFYGPSSDVSSGVPNPLMQQESFVQQILGYRTPYWQGISGLHPGNKGYGTSTIRSLTDFGSGFNRDKALTRAANIFTNPIVGGLGTAALLGIPSFHDPVRVSFLATQSAFLGYARGGVIGAGVGLAAFWALDKAGSAINEAAQQGQTGQPTNVDIMRHFMLYGIVEGGLAAGTSAAFLQGSPLRPLAHEVVGLMGGIRAGITGTPYEHHNIEGLEDSLQEVASPLRKWYQSSIVESAGFFEKKVGMSPEFAMKFSEAFHGESAYVMREARTFGGLKEIPHPEFYKALAKDVAIGAAGGLIENTIVGAAYLGIAYLLNRPIRISGKDDDYNTLSGLHPGVDGTMGAAAIQGMSAFGSGLDIDKVLDWNHYTSKIAVENRDYIQNILKSVHGANIIGFDIETTGLQTPLEMRKDQVGRMTEFSIKSNYGKVHGFTEHANMTDYANLFLKPGAFAGQFEEAAKRYGKYYDKGYKASEVLEQLASHIQPGRTNILVGHNIHSFDLKFLSAELALERGHVTPSMLSAWRVQPNSQNMAVINEGWERANQEIRRVFEEKDKNLMVVDTLGGFGRFPRVYPEAEGHGVARAFQGGYTPGLADFWAGAGVEKSGLNYAMQKGTKLEPFMKYMNIPFRGMAHDPAADVEGPIDLLRGLASSDRLPKLNAAIDANRMGPLKREMSGFISHQILEQQEAMKSPYITEGASELAKTMIAAAHEESLSLPSRTFNEAIDKLPLKTKFAVGGAGVMLAYAGYRMFFGPDKKVKDNTIEGLHPGAPRPGYMVGSGFGSGRIWSEIMEMGDKFLFETHPAVKARTGEIFTGESHGHALMKATQAGLGPTSGGITKESYGFRLPNKSFITRDQAQEFYGFRTSEDLNQLRNAPSADRIHIVKKHVKEMPTAGLTNHVLYENAIGHTRMGSRQTA